MKVSKTFSIDLEFRHNVDDYFDQHSSLNFSQIVCKLLRLYIDGQIKLEE